MLAKKTVLVADDNIAERKILINILSSNYNAIEVDDGMFALETFMARTNRIAAVIIDLSSPRLDAYNFIAIVKSNALISNTPILVSTDKYDREVERKLLASGASDLIIKPYDEDIITYRLKNAIESSQLSMFNQLKRTVEFDALTGIFNRTKFFEATREMLDANPSRKFIFVRFDINRFQLINSFFGASEGDKLLKYIASELGKFSLKFELITYGRLEADIFCLCVEKDAKNIIEELELAKKTIKAYELKFDIVPSFGIYFIDNNFLPVETMLDKANLAVKGCKGSYTKFFEIYNDKMSLEIIKEQEITNDMRHALYSGEFLVYFQPKYNILTNTLVGAEALVRWQHPVKGLVSPGEFIPIFERNGFIVELDAYVWEEVCKYISKWLAEGKEVFPISVNVSRVNIYNPNLVKQLTELVDKYEVPHSLFNLEITESAYTNNQETLIDMLENLHKNGFIVMMDDFGSGFSSLNILKDLEVDTLKIDMRFLSDAKIAGRGENIISSVVRMSRWLNIPVIAEGVEKKEQVDFLRSIGCRYVQGYYFSRPVPVDNYEALISRNQVFIDNKSPSAKFNADELWSANTRIESLFGKIMDATAILEYNGKNVDILRVNQAYYDLFGYKDLSITEEEKSLLIDESYKSILMDAINVAIEKLSLSECEFSRKDANGSVMWLHVKLKYINKIGGDYLIYAVLTDITEQKEMDIELQQFRRVLSAKTENKNNVMLIVDDVEMNRNILRELFSPNFEIHEAINGEEALNFLSETESVDIILLDLVMPVMDGKEFLKHKNALPNFKNTPVILITSDDSVEQQINILSLGANDYIVKPFVSELVMRRVNNVIESNKRFSEILREYNDVAEQAETDYLTGIYNRKKATDLINNVLKSSYAVNAMLMLDIDEFKSINDNFGHICGDNVLKQVAEELKKFFNGEDIVARLGGDEFCVFIKDVTSTESVIEKCEYLNDLISKVKFENDIVVHFSIGVAFSSNAHIDFDKMYNIVDNALYEAKRRGKGQCYIALNN